MKRHPMSPRFVLELLIAAGLLAAIVTMASCVSASYIHREFYPPPAPKPPSSPTRQPLPKPTIRACSFQEPTYAPSGKGPVKSETIITGQDSREILRSAQPGSGGTIDRILSWAGEQATGNGLLSGVLGSTTVGAGLIAWLRGRKTNALQDTITETAAQHKAELDRTWDEAYHVGMLARGPVVPPPPPAGPAA